MTGIDYHVAAIRHFSDAEYLLADSEKTREENAGQLYGFVAECAIKTILIAGDPSLLSGNKIKKEFKIHADQLHQAIPAMELRLAGRTASKCFSMVPSLSDFADWHTDHRYYTGSRIPPSLPKWRNAAKLFSETMYERIDPSQATMDESITISEDQFNFDLNDQDAPHYPIRIKWNPRFQEFSIDLMDKIITEADIAATFGDFLSGVKQRLNEWS